MGLFSKMFILVVLQLLAIFSTSYQKNFLIQTSGSEISPTGKDYAGGCPPGKVEVNTGACTKSIPPQCRKECRAKKDYAGGCPPGKVKVYTGACTLSIPMHCAKECRAKKKWRHSGKIKMMNPHFNSPRMTRGDALEKENECRARQGDGPIVGPG